MSAPEPAPQRALAPSQGRPPPLPPTEHWVHQDAEMTNKQRRKQYFRERHRAPEGVDTKAIERANGLASLARRNALALQRSAEVPGPKWVERGSENQAGRMMVAALSADGSALYAGSSLGGVWRGTLAGDDWEPLGDNLYGGAHWLALFPPDEAGGPEVMLAATDGGLVHRSADDGLTWVAPTGLGELWEVHRLVVLKDGTHTAFLVGRRASDFDWGLFRSTDRGASWAEIRDLGGFEGDVWVPRDGGSTVWLVDEGNEVFRSEDRGDSFVPVASFAPSGFQSVELAGSEAGAPSLWIGAHRGDGVVELYRSQDAGLTWTYLQDLEDYWGVLQASIVDPELVVNGGVELRRSGAAGLDFEAINAWSDYYDDPFGKLHADMMGVDVVPDGQGGEVWYIGTDGGLYESRDGLATVENLSMRGLRVGQYYDVLTNRKDPSQVAAGSQDQGYQLTNGIAQAGERWDFDQTVSGDYGHLTSSDGTHAYVYSVYPGFLMVQEGGNVPVLHYVDFPPGAWGAWLPPVVADPERKKAVFWAGSQLFRYSYDPLFETWSPELWSDQIFASGSDTLSGLGFSPLDPQQAVAVTSDGRLFRSKDKGRSWSETSDEGPDSSYLYGTAVTFSITDVDTVWVAGSGYGGPAVLRSRTGGKNWQAFDEGLPETLVYCLCEAPDGSGVLFAGTETGAWRRDPGAESVWQEITGVDAPITTYWSCEPLQTENTVRFGTYGRGIWDYQLDPEGTGCFPPVDRDGDGVDCDLDCDDADPEIYPGAPDPVCDGVDNDCDPINEVPEAVCAEQASGCGCSGTGGSAPWGAVMLAVLALGRRRQGR